MSTAPMTSTAPTASTSTTSFPGSRQLVNFAEKLIAYGLPVLYFLIAVAFYLRTYDSAQIKITLIQIGGTLLLGTWLVKVIEDDLDYFRRNLIIIIPLLAFLVSGVVSYFRSPFPYASANELVRRVLYVSMALILIGEFNSQEKLRRLFNWLIAAAFVTTLYGVIQYLDWRFFPRPPEPGLDPFIWRGAFGERIFSTFGNPNFFGDFLVVMSPIVLALYLRARRFYMLLLWLLIAFCVMATVSKGAWLGFGAGLLIFTFLAVGFFSHGQKAKQRRTLIIMVVGTVLLIGGGMYHQMKKRPDSSSFRLFTWISTWEMINTKPWLGTGVGTFYVTYPAWRRPQIFFIEGRHNTETDHPEDEYLEVWYDEGFVGFGIFLLLLATFLTVSFRNLSAFSKMRGENGKIDIRAYYQLGILSALAAQLAHNFVCVSLRFVSSGVMLWLLIGLIGSLNINNPLPEKFEPSPKPGNPLPLPLRRILQALVLVAVGYFVWVFYGYFKADVNHNLAIFYSKQGQWPAALERYTTVAKENPSFIMAHYFMGNVYNDRWSQGDPELSIKKYQDVWNLAPNYVQSHHQAGLIYLKWGEDEKRKADEARQRGDMKAAAEHEKMKTDAWNKALSEFERYRNIDPIFPLNYYRIAWIYQQLGQNDKAEAAYKAHLEFPEKLQHPPHNAWKEDWAVRRKDEYAETCINLGNLKFLENDWAGAEKYYKKGLEYNPQSVNAMKNLAAVYNNNRRPDLAEQICRKLLQIAPNDPDVQRMFRPAQKK